MAKSDIYVAKDSFSAVVEGVPYAVNKGERVRKGHPLLNGREDLFDPADLVVHYDIEQATAAPGEKRRTPEPPPAPVPAPEAAPQSGKPLEELSRQDLMKRAVEAGVPAKGSSAELIDAIRAAEQAS